MSWQTALVKTDTVCGLVCKVDSPEAIDKIYELKGRDRSKPLILFGGSLDALKEFAEGWYLKVESLAHHYWPGPLTIILPRSKKLPDCVNPGFDSIGLRVPDSKSVMKLLKEAPAGVLLSTSANLSGEPEFTDFELAKEAFADKVDLILEPEADEKSSGEASTVVKFEEDNMTVLRQGEVFVGLA